MFDHHRPTTSGADGWETVGALACMQRRAAMQRYFFNVYDGADRFDLVGTLLPNKGAVRHHMLAQGADILKAEPTPKTGWRMEVLDTNGKIICGMHFGIEDEEHA